MMDLKDILEKVRSGELSTEDAAGMLRHMTYEDLGYAKVDHQRRIRQGESEVIYGEGKSKEQILGIVQSLRKTADRVMVTRISSESAEYLMDNLSDVDHRKECNICICGSAPAPSTKGYVAVVTAGTSDIPVAEEAAVTAEVLGARTVRVFDVGVAGLHRLIDRLDVISNADAVIAVAGMEGALASVLGGLVNVPVIAVPTSVGYGASFGGLSALLAMMNSCASGVTVVNIDNGFGAGFSAARICRMCDR